MEITQLPVAATIDGVQDTFPIVTNSINTTQQISRNVFLGISSQPVGINDSQTLTSKTITSPTISGPTLSGTITGTYTIGGTPTFPASVVTLSGSQTLTNKILTSPTINTATISNPTLTVDTISGYSNASNVTAGGVTLQNGAVGGTTGTFSGLLTASSGFTVSSGTITLPNGSVSTLSATNPYKFFAYRNASYSTGATGQVTVPFDTKLYDTGTNFSTSTYLFTAPVAGYYVFSVTVTFGQASGYTSNIQLLKNGSSYLAGNQLYTGSAITIAQSFTSPPISLAANDTMGVQWNNTYTSGVGFTVGTAPYATWFSGYLVSKT